MQTAADDARLDPAVALQQLRRERHADEQGHEPYDACMRVRSRRSGRRLRTGSRAQRQVKPACPSVRDLRLCCCLRHLGCVVRRRERRCHGSTQRARRMVKSRRCNRCTRDGHLRRPQLPERRLLLSWVRRRPQLRSRRRCEQSAGGTASFCCVAVKISAGQHAAVSAGCQHWARPAVSIMAASSMSNS